MAASVMSGSSVSREVGTAGGTSRAPAFNNCLLDAVAELEPALLLNRVKPLNFVQGDVLAEAAAPIEHAIFPRSGLISITVPLENGDRIQTAMVGCQGAIGGAAVFGHAHGINTAIGQFPGSAWAIHSSDLEEISSALPELCRILFAQERFLIAQAQQTAACNAKHTINQRLCSWLLRAHDACGMGELLITQESLAELLGVQRATLSAAASQLKEQGLIQYRRGRLQIQNAEGLAAQACECCFTIREHSARLIEKCAADIAVTRQRRAELRVAMAQTKESLKESKDLLNRIDAAIERSRQPPSTREP